MSSLFGPLARHVARDGAAALVSVLTARGSTPREAGARMLVTRDGGVLGTIGGGRLEMAAIERAAALLAGSPADTADLLQLALGPSIGQCCGGHVGVAIEVFTTARGEPLARLAAAEAAGCFQTEASFIAGAPVDRQIVGQERRPADARLDRGGRLAESFGTPLRPLLLFGAGHVGRAIVLATAPLPFAVEWIDSRPDAFPRLPFANLSMTVDPAPAARLARAPDDAFVLILTHDHGQDLDILNAALAEGRFAYVGMIGSATKRARFERRLIGFGHPEARARSFVCPIGVPGITSKEPALIAAAVAAELLIADERQRAAAGAPLLELLADGSPENRRSAQFI